MFKNHVVIVGAGISGLAVAYWLNAKGYDVTVLEKDSNPGGTMKTLNENGWLVETGPNSALETTPLFNQIFKELGILDERIYTNEASNNRYICGICRASARQGFFGLRNKSFRCRSLCRKP
ncbi:MAG: FAD-dependent oxidoreductase [Bacteroidota bacterium]|nr:FAD-dependent oxidoreductase [Bacteroidota bacterium]